MELGTGTERVEMGLRNQSLHYAIKSAVQPLIMRFNRTIFEFGSQKRLLLCPSPLKYQVNYNWLVSVSMRKLIDIRVVSAALMLLVGHTATVPAGVTVDAELSRVPESAAAKKVGLRSAKIDGAPAIELAPLALAARPKKGPEKPPIGPLEIGVGREIPAQFNKVLDGGTLTWNVFPDGSRVARLTIKSPDALAIRAGLSVFHIPDQAELGFFSAGVKDPKVERVSGAEINETIARDRAARDKDDESPLLYWSPIIEGEVFGIEVFLPSGVLAKDLRIAVTLISHLLEYMAASLTCPNGIGVNCSSDCNLNAMCYADTWGDVIPAVAKMMFTTESGGTAVCSGNLINDSDPNSQIPYFLTARHCINTQSVASTLSTLWFFQPDGCTTSHESKTFETRSGGATLLAELPEVDMALLRLNTPPPEGAVFAGWETNPVEHGQNVVGIHHPAGDLKKISLGYVRRYDFCELVIPTDITAPAFGDGFFCNPSDIGTYLNVLYPSGTTEGGSSGSGVFRDGTHRLIGTLTGGNASCSFREGDTLYGRFDIAYKNKLYKWLGVANACSDEPGSWAYCANPACGPCEKGEGDCDSNSECKTDLICVDDVGANYGFDSKIDVCEEPSGELVETECRLSPGEWDYCVDPNCGPCNEHEGDCDSNLECVDGLVCRQDLGANFGFNPSMDVCGLAPEGTCNLPNGDWAYCSDPFCGPCGVGQGDCDSDADCNAGLVCAFNRGADYGLPESLDVCEVSDDPSCTKAVGAWDYCDDPRCGPCTEGQGDCDADVDCAEGLVCAYNSGEQYGLPPTLDVCESRQYPLDLKTAFDRFMQLVTD